MRVVKSKMIDYKPEKLRFQKRPLRWRLFRIARCSNCGNYQFYWSRNPYRYCRNCAGERDWTFIVICTLIVIVTWIGLFVLAGRV
jgi:hypothetical protein